MNEIFRTTQISYQNCVVLAYSVTYDLGYNSLNPLPNHQTYIENIIVYFPQWKPVFASQISPPSVQFSHSVVSNSLQPHGRQRAKLPCPSPTPGAYTNSCPLSRWCHPTILSSFVPFSSCLQTFPASGSFPMRQFSPSGGQNIGVSASISSPSSEYSGLISFRMEWLDLFAGTLKSLLQHHSWKAAILWNSALYSPTLISIHDY